MEVKPRNEYTLLLSYDPCEIFEYYRTDQMHGLNYEDCKCHENNSERSYIAGWSNVVPNQTYRFVFINLTRANNDIELFALLMHELMHESFARHKYDIDKEEDIITWAEEEAKEIYGIISNTSSQEK